MRLLSKEQIILIGNILDHVVTSVYLFSVSSISAHFLPSSKLQITFGYLLLLTSAFGKPIGAYFFSKFRPSQAISYGFLILAISCILLAIIPGHNDIGYISTTLLILIKIISDITYSGIDSISKIFILEGKKGKKAFRFSWLYPLSSTLGGVISYYLCIKFDFKTLYFAIGSLFLCISISLATTSKKDIYTKSREKIYVLSLDSKSLFVILSTTISYITWYLPFSLIDLLFQSNKSTSLGFINLLMLISIGIVLEKINFVHAVRNCMFILFISILLLPLAQGFLFLYKVWIMFLGIIILCPQHLFYKALFDDSYVNIGLLISIGAVIGKLMPSLVTFIYYITNDINLAILPIVSLCGFFQIVFDKTLEQIEAKI